MITAQDSTILLAIATAGACGGNWPPMLAAFCEYLRADAAWLHSPQGSWSLDGPCAHGMPQALAGLRLGRVYTGEELIERQVVPNELPDAADQRAIGIREHDSAAWLVIARNRSDFRAADSAALTALAPHLGHALAMAAQQRAGAESAAQSERLLRRLGVGQVQWDRSGRLMPCDSIARDILAGAPEAADLHAPEGDEVLYQIGPNMELLVQRDADNTRTGFLRVSNQSLPDERLIARALGVSLPEARLARALGQGDTLREAAQRLNITIETARFYSKQIYAKTGLRGQPDLIRRLWSGALIMA